MLELLTNMEWLPTLLSALLSGGLVAIFTLPQKMRAERIENDQKVISECYALIDRLNGELDERECRIDKLQKRVAELEAQVRDLESQLSAMKQRRGKDGRFQKKAPASPDQSDADLPEPFGYNPVDYEGK